MAEAQTPCSPPYNGRTSWKPSGRYPSRFFGGRHPFLSSHIFPETRALLPSPSLTLFFFFLDLHKLLPLFLSPPPPSRQRPWPPTGLPNAVPPNGKISSTCQSSVASTALSLAGSASAPYSGMARRGRARGCATQCAAGASLAPLPVISFSESSCLASCLDSCSLYGAS